MSRENEFKKLQELDKQSIWHPYTQIDDEILIPIKKTKDSYLIDYNDKKYIDAVSSWWVNILGHTNKRLAKIIYKQASKTDQIIFSNFTHKPAIQLADKLLKILPFPFSKIFYSDNGSTSVEVAIKIALQFWGEKKTKRKKIVAFQNSYHGDTFGAMSVSNRSLFTKEFENYLFEVEFIPTPTEKEVPKVDWENVLAFIYEPLVQGAGGMLMYPRQGMNQLLKNAEEHNVLLIADEVMTGFGRTGALFASEHLKIPPDLICLSKGITAGYLPLGVTVINEKIANDFLKNKKAFYHGHSYTANPLSCEVANATLLILNEDKIYYHEKWQEINKLHSQFIEKLKKIKCVHNTRVLGTLLAFDIQNSEKKGYENSIGKEIKMYCLKNGVLIRPLGNTVYIMPPYCISKKELKTVYSVLIDFLEKYEKAKP